MFLSTVHVHHLPKETTTHFVVSDGKHMVSAHRDDIVVLGNNISCGWLYGVNLRVTSSRLAVFFPSLLR